MTKENLLKNLKCKSGKLHIGISIEGLLRLWSEGKLTLPPDMVINLRRLVDVGIKTYNSCPDAIEESPGHFVCPGHPVEPGCTRASLRFKEQSG